MFDPEVFLRLHVFWENLKLCFLPIYIAERNKKIMVSCQNYCCSVLKRKITYVTFFQNVFLEHTQMYLGKILSKMKERVNNNQWELSSTEMNVQESCNITIARKNLVASRAGTAFIVSLIHLKSFFNAFYLFYRFAI